MKNLEVPKTTPPQPPIDEAWYGQYKWVGDKIESIPQEDRIAQTEQRIEVGPKNEQPQVERETVVDETPTRLDIPATPEMIPFIEYAKEAIHQARNPESLKELLRSMERNAGEFITSSGVPFSVQEVIGVAESIEARIKNGEPLESGEVNQELQKIPNDLGIRQRFIDLLKIEQIKQLLH